MFERLIDESKTDHNLNDEKGGDVVSTGVHGRSVQIDTNFILQMYIDHVRTNYPSKNASDSHEFWKLFRSRYRLLAQFAIDLLSIPTDATLPFGSFSANYDSNEDGDDFSMSNPVDFIQMTQSVDENEQNTRDLEKNAIIKLNRYLLMTVTESKSRKKILVKAKKRPVDKNDLDQLHENFNEEFVQRTRRSSHSSHGSRSTKSERIKRKRSPTPDRHQESRNSSRRRSPTPERHRESRNSSHRRSPTPDRHRKSRSSSRRRSPTPERHRKSRSKKSSSPPPFETPVIMVYRLDQMTFTCEFIFNLFSCYGNVRKKKQKYLYGGNERQASGQQC